jgi:uncharacterized protein GlcG (DUF336 family)
MSVLSLAAAQTIVQSALQHARGQKLKPLAVVALDARGSLVAAGVEDGNSLGRWQIAFGKAYGCLFLGVGARKVEALATDRPLFFGAVAHLPTGGVIPVQGGVLVRDAAGEILGAVGVSGDLSANDEAAAVAGVEAAGLKADAG